MSIGDRIKRYESVSNYQLLPREPVIIRVDGKAFHSFTRKMDKPFDLKFVEAMLVAGEKTAKEIMGFKLGYHQSDEFTFLLSDLDSFETECWFNNEIQKLASVTASLFTAYFNEAMGGTTASFDGRAFNVPLEDSPNVFIWRQRDWERNSLQMFSRSFFSHRRLKDKKRQDMHDMLFEIGENWADLSDMLKNGTFITKDGKRINKKMDYLEVRELLK